MELIILPKDLSEELLNHNLSEINSKELDEIIHELNEIDEKAQISEVNLGKGADWILIFALLGSVTSVIALGDKLEKGIDGWIKIGKRLRNIFRKSDRAYVDENGAKILAITKVSESYNIESIELTDCHTTYLVDFSTWFPERHPQDFKAKPFNIYYFTFEINNERTIVLCIKSSGEITEIIDIENERKDLPF